MIESLLDNPDNVLANEFLTNFSKKIQIYIISYLGIRELKFIFIKYNEKNEKQHQFFIILNLAFNSWVLLDLGWIMSIMSSEFSEYTIVNSY